MGRHNRRVSGARKFAFPSRSGQESQRFAVTRSNHGETMVEGRHLVEAEALRDRDHRRVGCPQSEIAVGVEEFRNTIQILVGQVHEFEVAATERANEVSLGRAAFAADHVADLGDHEWRDQTSPPGKMQPGEEIYAGSVVASWTIAAATTGPVSTTIKSGRSPQPELHPRDGPSRTDRS